jgi:lysylphosphatidylglycerol synthetase-like protein (DUF2156 family)
MSSEIPQVGQISPDGMFRWDGGDWQPLARGHREPTSWTRPMQLGVTAYLVLGAINGIVTAALFLNSAAIERSVRTGSPGLSDEQARQAVSQVAAESWTTAAIITLVALVLAVGSYLGWRWTFWADLVWLALMSFGVVVSVVSLQLPSAGSMPVGEILASLLLSLAALALLIWFVAAAARYGPWALRRPG